MLWMLSIGAFSRGLFQTLLYAVSFNNCDSHLLSEVGKVLFFKLYFSGSEGVTIVVFEIYYSFLFDYSGFRGTLFKTLFGFFCSSKGVFICWSISDGGFEEIFGG